MPDEKLGGVRNNAKYDIRKNYLCLVQRCRAMKLLAFLAIFVVCTPQQNNNIILTVNGPIAADKLGITLPHEHLMVDFIGADSIKPGRYNADSVLNKALPFINELKKHNATTIFECTPNYLGRDVKLLQRLSNATGINIVTNTGYYGAVRHKYLPKHTYTESAQQLADRWINEFRNGIDGTQVKPGFIKLSADKGPLSEVQRKVITAGAIAHHATKLTIAVHSGDGNAAKEELKILTDNNVPADAFIWVHAQNESNFDVFREVASKGAWVEFDGLSDDNVPQYVSFIKFMKQNNLLHRTLVSHDAGYYSVGEPNGGTFRSYTSLFVRLIPALQKEGFTRDEVDMLVRKNPAQAYAIGQ